MLPAEFDWFTNPTEANPATKVPHSLRVASPPLWPRAGRVAYCVRSRFAAWSQPPARERPRAAR
ncbi:hypothetical protein Acsp03_69940 [Actinomadura sp. NBRC 104412]|nr:hypothetical protein Acsp03_69940 [Actinomadura sp. NBRC 104412]